MKYDENVKGTGSAEPEIECKPAEEITICRCVDRCYGCACGMCGLFNFLLLLFLSFWGVWFLKSYKCALRLVRSLFPVVFVVLLPLFRFGGVSESSRFVSLN